MTKVLIFGGTTEGRLLAEFAAGKLLATYVSVATSYGAAQMEKNAYLKIRAARLDKEGMKALLEREQPLLIIDATHPYAQEVSHNIAAACGELGRPFLRVGRESQGLESFTGLHFFSDLDSMVDFVKNLEGNIFSSLGFKNAQALTQIPDYQERVYLRILPSAQGFRALEALGFASKNLIGMQGPFSKELNKAMFAWAEAKILLSKDSGLQGGFLEKMTAAQELGMTICILRRPPDAEGYSLAAVKERIEELCHV